MRTRSQADCSRLMAMLCIVALLLMVVVQNVHTHGHGCSHSKCNTECRIIKAYAATEHHCIACDMLASGQIKAFIINNNDIGVIITSVSADIPPVPATQETGLHLPSPRAPPAS